MYCLGQLVSALQTCPFRVPEGRLNSSDAVPRSWVSPSDRVTDTHATKRPCQRLFRKRKGAPGSTCATRTSTGGTPRDSRA